MIQPVPGRVVVVIPCYNAGARLRAVLGALLSAVVDVVVVDDGSTDGSAEIKDLICGPNTGHKEGDHPTDVGNPPRVRTVRFAANRGKGHALLAGIEAALNLNPEAVILMDADGQHDPAHLTRLLAAVTESKADLVIGQRDFRFSQVPFASWLGNRITSLLAWVFLGRWIPDTQCGYRALSPRFARAVLQQVPGGRYETETAMLALAVLGKYRIEKIPVSTRYEPGNRSSHFRKGIDSLRVLAELIRSACRYRKTAGKV